MRWYAAAGRGVVWRGTTGENLARSREGRARGRSVSANRNVGGGLSGGGPGADREVFGRPGGGNQHRGNWSLGFDRRIPTRTVGRAVTAIDRMKICYLDAFSGI